LSARQTPHPLQGAQKEEVIVAAIAVLDAEDRSAAKGIRLDEAPRAVEPAVDPLGRDLQAPALLRPGAVADDDVDDLARVDCKPSAEFGQNGPVI
jgi:hypothetical protein